jgi:hypothetical protein
VKVEKEVGDHLDLAEGLKEAGGMMIHRLKVWVKKEVEESVDLAEEGLREAAGVISSAH